MISSLYLQMFAAVSLRGWILLRFWKRFFSFWCQESSLLIDDNNGDKTFIESLLYSKLWFNQEPALANIILTQLYDLGTFNIHILEMRIGKSREYNLP